MATSRYRAGQHRRGLRPRRERAHRRGRRAPARAARTRPARPAATSSPAPTTRPTGCRCASPARATTSGPTSTRRRSSRSSSPTPLDDEPLPLYGDGLQVRDWLYVDDHCAAIELVLERGEPGTTYNVGGGNELTNLELTRAHPGAARQAGVARAVGPRPPRPRPPLRRRQRPASGRSAGRLRTTSATPWPRRWLVSRASRLVAAAEGRGVSRLLPAPVRGSPGRRSGDRLIVRVAITGATGQLGRELVSAFARRDEVTALGHGDLDLADPDAGRAPRRGPTRHRGQLGGVDRRRRLRP